MFHFQTFEKQQKIAEDSDIDIDQPIFARPKHDGLDALCQMTHYNKKGIDFFSKMNEYLPIYLTLFSLFRSVFFH